MIINTGWLLDYLSPRCSAEDILGALPRAGLEIEAAAVLRSVLEPVRIGFIRTKDILQGAEGMFVCQVQVGASDTRQIICASEHPIEVGWGVPVALAGTELPLRPVLREDHFHGVLSQGMVCLDGELGMIARQTGLQVFHDESTLGRSLVEVSDVSEVIIHIKAPPNRPDCLGLIGIAREIAAVLDLKLVIPETRLPTPADSQVPMPVTIASPDGCSRYTCQKISGVRIAKSPPWLHSRLQATGSRPINNVVDITNFVMQEWSQPLHAFDLRKLTREIVVRRMQAEERLLLLDGSEAKGESAALAIADGERPVALAGLMGGFDTSIQRDTTEVLLEAAHFDAATIRRCRMDLGMSTDASYRFERGMDPNETLDAARDRAVALLLEVAGGTSISPLTDNYVSKAGRRIFSLTPGRVSSYLGTPVAHDTILSSLEKLGYACSPDLSRIQAPTRRVDANDAVVLIEDVARVVGYDSIPLRASEEAPTRGKGTALEAIRALARGLLTAQGYLEIRGVPLEAVAAETTELSRLDWPPIAVANPMRADQALLRQSLLPALLKTAGENASRHASTFRYFEIDKLFGRSGDELMEPWALGILLGGVSRDLDWSGRRNADFYDLKGTVEALSEALRCPAMTFVAAPVRGYELGTAARIRIGGIELGVIGQISEKASAARKIYQKLYAAELFLEPLAPPLQERVSFQPLPRFPAVFRDLSLVVDKSFTYADIEQAIRAAANGYLQSVTCIDVFQGKGIPESSRSVTVSLVFRASDKTLASQDVNKSVDRIVDQLSTRFGVELRNR